MKSLEAISRFPRSGRRVAATLVLAITFCGCSPGGDSSGRKERVRFLEEANRLARAGRPRGAAELLERSLEGARFPSSPAVYGRIAEYYLASGSNQAALRFCAKALSVDGRNPAALAVRGEAHRRLVNLDDARSALNDAIRLAPGHPRASLSLARLEFRAGKPLGSLPLFDTYFSAKAEAADDALSRTARLEYGRALRAAGRYQDSADQLAIALEEEPTRSECYSELAAALYRLKRRQEARLIEGIYRALSQGSFEEYGVDKMRLQGREAQALAQQASNQQRQRRFLEAFRSHRSALEANNKDARIPGLYARYCLAFRRTREGLDVISAAVAGGCRPVSGLLWERGRIEVARKDWSAAVEAFRSTLQAISSENGGADRPKPGRGQANSFSAQLGLARSLLELGRRGPASEAIAAAQKLSPSAWEPSYWRGRWLLSGGDPGPALEAFKAAEENCRRQELQVPDDLAAYKVVARWRSGYEPGALEALVAQLERAPGRLELYAELMKPEVKDPVRQEWARKRLAEMKANQERIDQLEARLQESPFAASAAIYADLAVACAKFRERAAYDYLFLASDLDPANAAVLKNLLNILSRPQDVFFRLRLLRRLLDAEAGSEAALYGMAEIFLKLHVRLGEARQLVQSGLDSHPGSLRLKALQERLAALDAGASSSGKGRP